MITALLIDDEAHCITALSHDLAMFCPQVTIVKTCQSAREGIEAIRQYNPDLVFLDIEMPGMDGFGMLKELGDSIDFQVVFTTAYNDFVLKAIRANAMDYLMKPIDGAELADAVARVEKQVLTKFREQRRLNNLLASAALPEEQQRIALPDRNKYDFVCPTEICYCKAEGGYTNVYFVDKRKMLVSKGLGELEAMMPTQLFERIHHSVIVNLNHIKQFKKGDALSVTMSNGDTLNVSRSKKDQLLLRLGIR